MDEDFTNKDVLDLSNKFLKKVPREDDAQRYRILVLDNNELQKIDNIDSYCKIEKLSLQRNQLLRMYGVSRLNNLRELNLSYNGILSIEGLKELLNLTYLNLEGNNIKTIEHLNANTKLKCLNLSENSIGSVSDISFLKCLKELYLHGNRLTHLRQSDKYLPSSLETLTLAKNNINDLNEICSLTGLGNLQNLTINDNPCVQMTMGADGFDYRPFVLNWCMTLKTIDTFIVDPIESLKAEWLYSQGRGRQFRVGEQENLSRYLSSVCPLLGKALENENERKLRLILSKAQQHQRQLQEEIIENVNTSGNNSPSTGRRKPSSRIHSPRLSRLSGRQSSPESMSNSYHGNTSYSPLISGSHETRPNVIRMTTSLIENVRNDSLMSQSFDGVNKIVMSCKKAHETHPRPSSRGQYDSKPGGPLTAASKMVPVPETLMSPDICPSTTQHISVCPKNSQNVANAPSTKITKGKNGSLKVTCCSYLKRNNEKSPTFSPRKLHTTSKHQQALRSCLIDSNQEKCKSSQGSVNIIPSDCYGGISSEDDSDNVNVDKLKTIRNKAAQRSQQQKENIDISAIKVNPETETSAIIIQKTWRGYNTRKKYKHIAEQILKKRTQEYIRKISKDMELAKAQLENERKIQQLQMQAINALWKKVSSLQPTTVANGTEQAGPITNTRPTVVLDNNSTAIVNDLAKTCSTLTSQVQQLQGSMRDILNCMTFFCGLPHDSLRKTLSSNGKKGTSATQTEIIAVHSPQVDEYSFPFKNRPSTLPLDPNNIASAKQAEESLEKNFSSPSNKMIFSESTEISSMLNHDSSGESISMKQT